MTATQSSRSFLPRQPEDGALGERAREDVLCLTQERLALLITKLAPIRGVPKLVALVARSFEEMGFTKDDRGRF